MIIRVWRGWTTPENADAYEALLREEITGESVNGEQTPGMLGIDVLRHDPDATDDNSGAAADDSPAAEVEFSTIMYFFDWDAVRAFAGDDAFAAVVPDADRALLTRWDERSRHYDLLSRNGQWKTLADG
ncbi:hypothetical protein ABH935_005867 [Catenulispora sp. GAS73]|uniref:antibiotic biosynthesis monooxygenase n=1 Tax=Catenulispora sp. GAS73 TaxID=3156269 RepID=UPI00351338B1